MKIRTALAWESAGTDEPGDQHADSARRIPNATSAYYALGPADPGWSLELIFTEHGDEIGYERLGWHATEAEAKRAAEAHEPPIMSDEPRCVDSEDAENPVQCHGVVELTDPRTEASAYRCWAHAMAYHGRTWRLSDPELCAEEVDTIIGDPPRWGFRPCGETERRDDGLCIRHDAHRRATAERIVQNNHHDVIKKLSDMVKYAYIAWPDATGHWDRPAVLARILADLQELK